MNIKKILSVALSAIIVTLAIPHASAQTAQDKKLIALTFDDGPNTTTTNDVLDILEKYNAKGTFFLVGDCINEESAKSVKRAYDMGCEIGNHSKTHSNMSSMSAEEIKAEIDYVDDWVVDITGETTTFFRPPFIDTSQNMYDTIDKPFICGIDTGDYMDNVTAEQRAENIINGAQDGVIVLLHDLAGNTKTVEALEIVMPKLIEMNYEFVTVSELFERQGETPKEELIYTYVTKYPCADYKLLENLFSGEVTGNSSSGDWSKVNDFDAQKLKDLGDDYALEIDYQGTNPPMIALQKWNGASIWHTILPYYSNGEKACFLAEDILKGLDAVGADYTDLDRISLRPSDGEITLTSINLLIKSENQEIVKGDVNSDGVLNAYDVSMIQRWLVNKEEIIASNVADVDENGVVNVFDVCILKRICRNNTIGKTERT